MSHLRRRTVSAIALVAAVAGSGCAGHSPVEPSAAAAQAVATGNGTVHSTVNHAPEIFLKTNPPADGTTVPYPTITGVVPFDVRFNLCVSSDPDTVILPSGDFDPNGDLLNWQFNFGDGPKPAFNADGTFNADFDHFCRVTHTYTEPGRYVATLNVTDKHLEDQSHEVGAMAHTFTRVTIDALPRTAPTPEPAAPNPDAPIVLTFTAGLVDCSGETHLTWTTSQATGVMIDQGVGSFGPTGTNVDAHPVGVFDGMVLTLTAIGPAGQTSRSVTLHSSCS